MKSTRPFRLSVAALFEFLTSAHLIQPAQIPLVGIVTHGPFTAAHVHSSKPRQLADFCFQATLWCTRQQGSLQCPPFQAPVSCFPELLPTRVPSDQRALMQRCDHGASSDQCVCYDSDTAAEPKIHQLALDPRRSRARRDGCEQLSQLVSATLFCFFAQQLRTQTTKSHETSARPSRRLVRDPVGIRAAQELSEPWVVKGETLPSTQQVLSPSSVQLVSPLSCPQGWATRQHLQDMKLQHFRSSRSCAR